MTEEQYKDSMYYSKTLGDRNFKAANEAFKNLNVKYAELKDDMKRMEHAMANVMKQNQELEQKLNILFAKSFGNGSTTQ